MIEIPLRGGAVAVVDDADAELVSGKQWYWLNKRYAAFSIYRQGGKHDCVLMHRLIMGLERGNRLTVDHVNGDGLDNRRENMRVCTHAENMRNQKVNKDSSSGTKGVCERNRGSARFKATITLNGKQYHLGYWPTFAEARAAYIAGAKILHGEYGRVADPVEIVEEIT